MKLSLTRLIRAPGMNMASVYSCCEKRRDIGVLWWNFLQTCTQVLASVQAAASVQAVFEDSCAAAKLELPELVLFCDPLHFQQLHASSS